MPILSIICPTYNRSALLQEAALSCKEIGVPVELLVVDDCSTDDTRSVLEDLSVHLKSNGVQLKYLATTKNSGAQVCRNLGFARSSGKYVMFIDSDDTAVPGGVARLIECLEVDASLAFAYGKVIRTDEHLRPLDGVPPVGEEYFKCPADAAGYHWHTMGPVYLKNYLEKVGSWNESLTGSQDWEFQGRVKLAGGNGRFVDTVVGYWRDHGGGRVGAKAFRPDYVRSAIAACDSILRHAQKAGQCDQALEKKLARRIVVHALEWGANGHEVERDKSLAQAQASLSGRSFFKTGIGCLRRCPSFCDSWFQGLLSLRRVCK